MRGVIRILRGWAGANVCGFYLRFGFFSQPGDAHGTTKSLEGDRETWRFVSFGLSQPPFLRGNWRRQAAA
jgi:hypothetical protein